MGQTHEYIGMYETQEERQLRIEREAWERQEKERAKFKDELMQSDMAGLLQHFFTVARRWNTRLTCSYIQKEDKSFVSWSDNFNSLWINSKGEISKFID